MSDDVDFSAELENYLEQHDYSTPRAGDIRKGIIVDASPEGIIVDLGLKRDGLVPPADLAKLSEEERNSLVVDMEIPVYIVDTAQPDSLNVSVHRALLNEDWIKAKEVMDSGEIVEAEVVGYNRGGALVEYGRLRGFIPLSQLTAFRPGMKDRDKQRMLSKLRGTVLPLKIIEVDRRRRRLVMSNRDAQREWDLSRREGLLEELEAGQVVTGQVSSLRDFGAFVDIGAGLEGLVHVSELAWHRIDHPRDVIRIGDDIEVYILKIDKESQRISLSRKRLLPDPWSTVEEKYAVGTLVEGRVTRIVNYGAFVELEPGIEGLLHASKLLRGNDTAEPGEVVREDETHLLRVISIDTQRQRIGLSLRAVTPKEQIEWMMAKENAEAAEADTDEDDGDFEEASDDDFNVDAEGDEAEAPVSEDTAEQAESVAEEAPASDDAGEDNQVDEAPATDEDASDSSDEAPATDEDAGDSSDDTPATDEDAGDSSDDTPATDEDAGDSSDDTPATDEDAGDSSDDTPATDEDAGDSSDEAPAIDEDASANAVEAPVAASADDEENTENGD